ncbi:MAG: MoaD/ThiS family protein [Calditrichia bacterium]
MKISVKIPALLVHCTNKRTVVEIDANTLSGALDTLLIDYPLLKPHLFNDKGIQREHVLIFLNEENIDWLDDPDIALKSGDRMTILQAVSGG